MKKLLGAMLLGAVIAFPTAVSAGRDAMQEQIFKRTQEAKQKLAAAEKAKGAERDKLMQEHMKMMQETMGKMRTMKPRSGMSMKEREKWMNEHQKLMDEMMGQMMQEHHMLMQKTAK